MANPFESHLDELKAAAERAEEELNRFREHKYEELKANNEAIKKLFLESVSEVGAHPHQDDLFAKNKTLRDSIQAKETWAARMTDDYNEFKALLSTKAATPKPPADATSAAVHEDTAPVTPSRLGSHTFLENVQCVVQDPRGEWVELACFVCGANSTKVSKSQGKSAHFIKGIKGIIQHIGSQHKEQKAKISGDSLWERCTKRKLSTAEMQKLQSGQESILENTGTPANPTIRQVSVILGDSADSPGPGNEPPDALADKATEPGIDAESEEDLPYDYIVGYECIVLRKDGVWVELRCPMCNGNWSQPWRRFLKGVRGFAIHLGLSHGVRFSGAKSKGKDEWILDQCTFREVPKKEIDSITDESDRPADYAADIPRIPVQVPSQPHTRLADTPAKNAEAKSAKKENSATKSAKMSARPDQIVDQAVPQTGSTAPPRSAHKDATKARKDARKNDRKTAANEQAVPKHIRLQGNKRRRIIDDEDASDGDEVMPKGGSRSRTTDVKTSKRDSSPATMVPSSNSQAAPPADFASYCPCTLHSHVCGSSDKCKLTKVCIRQTHDGKCDAQHSHEVRPTCIPKLLFGDCVDEGSCRYGHERLRKRMDAYHKHNCKEH